MIFYQNRGMFTETLVDNTIEWYFKNNIAFFAKNHIPFKLKNISKNQKQITGTIFKAAVDYYGIYQGWYMAFEVKETHNDFFLLNQLKKHQFYYLQTTKQFGGIAFIILNFLTNEKIYIITIEQIQKIKTQKINKISESWCQKNCYQMAIVFPGIIKWLDYFFQK